MANGKRDNKADGAPFLITFFWENVLIPTWVELGVQHCMMCSVMCLSCDKNKVKNCDFWRDLVVSVVFLLCVG